MWEYYWRSNRSQFCMYMYVFVSAHVCICIWRRKDKLRSYSLGAIHLVLWDKVSLGWNSLIRLNCMTSKPQRAVCLCLPSTGTTCSCHHTSFFFDVCTIKHFTDWPIYPACSWLSVFKRDQLADLIISYLFILLELIWRLLSVQYLCLLIRIIPLMWACIFGHFEVGFSCQACVSLEEIAHYVTRWVSRGPSTTQWEENHCC